MDQNQTTVDNDLQKAIDDITNTTNGDPVFSDPVAAPSSVPEGDTGELQEPVGPFPEPTVEMAPPAPEPIAPIEPVNIPDLGVPEMVAPADAPAMPPMPEVSMPPEVAPVEAPVEAPAPEAEPAALEPTPNEAPAATSSNLSMRQIKESALRDLVPLSTHLL